jgi:hypothetical protein
MQPVEPRWWEFYVEAKLLAGFETARDLCSYVRAFYRWVFFYAIYVKPNGVSFPMFPFEQWEAIH